MQRFLGVAAVTALILGASVAHADELTGGISSIDSANHTFMIGDQVFVAAPNNTVGPALQELKEGDKVTVFYEKNSSENVTNAVSIKRAE